MCKFFRVFLFLQDYHVYEARFPMPSDAMIVGTVKTEGELTVENVTIERGGLLFFNLVKAYKIRAYSSLWAFV